MQNVGIAFKILENDKTLPSRYKTSSGDLIYDIKMDFTRKVRWVKDGHKTPNSEIHLVMQASCHEIAFE